MEHWKPVAGYEGLYEVSDFGSVRSIPRIDTSGKHRQGRILKPAGQYPMIGLSKGSKVTTFAIHELVLRAFVGPAPKGHVCCHWDGNPWNNGIGNLRWDTRQANGADMIRHGRAKSTGMPGEKNPRAYLSVKLVLKIRALKAKGLSPQKIANQVGTTRWNVRQILSGKNWSHV